MTASTSTRVSQRQSQSAQPAAEKKYFDFICTGIGYLNRVREVSPSRGDAYTACTINVLVGPEGDVDYREFDMRVVGQQAFEALDLIDQAMKSDDDKVIVTFRAGDARPDKYTVQRRVQGSDEKQPQERLCLKGRLLQIMTAKVNGVPVELPQVERPDAASDEQSQDVHDEGHAGSDAAPEQHESAPEAAERPAARRPQRQSSGYRRAA